MAMELGILSMKNGESTFLPLDARLWLFWQTHWRTIATTGIFLVLGFLAWNGWQGIVHWQDRSMQRNFLAALEYPEQMEVFATKYRSRPLGALAWFMIGNGKGGTDNFSAAAAYSHCDGLKIARFDGMATLARAVALLRSGEESAAESLFRSLANDGAQPSVVRGGGWYFLGWINHGRGRDDLAKTALNAIFQLPFPGIWAPKAALLSRELDWQ
jgi:hypothetical protein